MNIQKFSSHSNGFSQSFIRIYIQAKAKLLMALLIEKSLLFVIFVMSKGNALIWSRHSMRLGYFNSLSDLDLTFFFKKSLSPICFKIARHFSKVGIGEAVILTQDDMRWVFLANPLELTRDPVLCRRIEYRAEPTAIQAFVYILRLIGSDPYLRNTNLDILRAPKWTFHRQQLAEALQIALPPLTQFPNICSWCDATILQIARQMKVPPPPEVNDFQAGLKGLLFRSYFPQKWLLYARRENCPILPSEEANFILREIEVEQIKWEMWGLLGQVRKSTEKNQIIEHLQNLAKMLNHDARSKVKIEEFVEYLQMIDTREHFFQKE